ncbi:hypothetical protein F7725_025949 [Dissostichus mawsoni]|uniref:Uncharacterized protein n=1 Tax=Dissostichus mawsoni TaxID=36200 RepID=A0A7J5X5N8_DISMA|nr:hypothetical protein F7725_025949 [Dissostichus mawsoni]
MRYSLFVSDRDDSPISTFTRLNCTFFTLGSHDLCRKPCSGSDKSGKKSACFTPASFSSSPPSSGCCDPLASSSRARDPEELERKRAGGGEVKACGRSRLDCVQMNLQGSDHQSLHFDPPEDRRQQRAVKSPRNKKNLLICASKRKQGGDPAPKLTPLFTTLQELLHNKRDDFKKISRFYARL